MLFEYNNKKRVGVVKGGISLFLKWQFMFYYNDTARLGHEINFRTCNAMQKQLIQIHEQHVALRVISPDT